MTTRRRADFLGPVESPCKKCGADYRLVYDLAKTRKLYWVVPLGTTHQVRIACGQCNRDERVIGTKGQELARLAVANMVAIKAAEEMGVLDAEEAPAQLNPGS